MCCNSCVKSWRNKKWLAKITRIKPFINKYNWEGINFPSDKDGWKTFDKNNVTIATYVLYVKKAKIYPAYVLKHNSNLEKQVILSKILNGERWHYLAVKKLSPFPREITAINAGDFYCLNCLYFYRTKDRLELLKKYVKIFVTL